MLEEELIAQDPSVKRHSDIDEALRNLKDWADSNAYSVPYNRYLLLVGAILHCLERKRMAIS